MIILERKMEIIKKVPSSVEDAMSMTMKYAGDDEMYPDISASHFTVLTALTSSELPALGDEVWIRVETKKCSTDVVVETVPVAESEGSSLIRLIDVLSANGYSPAYAGSIVELAIEKGLVS